jgi:hypothetical protein
MDSDKTIITSVTPNASLRQLSMNYSTTSSMCSGEGMVIPVGNANEEPVVKRKRFTTHLLPMLLHAIIDLQYAMTDIAHIKHLHSQQDKVLAAHRPCMFMRNTEAELDSYLASRPTNGLLNWVITWKPAIAASVKAARVLAANTMKRMHKRFDYLAPSAKRPARSRVPPRFHTHHDGNRSSRIRLWKAPPSV